MCREYLVHHKKYENAFEDSEVLNLSAFATSQLPNN